MSGKQTLSFLKVVSHVAVLGLLLTTVSYSQTTALPFRPVAAEYSLALDRIIMLSSNPNQLHIYDPSANSDVAVSLANAPLNFSLSPDGLHAAVAYSASVDYVNLQSGMVERNYPITVSPNNYGSTSTGKVVLGTNYFYILPGYEGSPSSVNLSSGAVTTGGFTYGSGGRYNSAVNAIYGLQNGISPNDLLRYNTSTGPISGVTASPYHGDFPICGDVWFSPDGSRVYTGCGTVFRASTDTTKDRRYVSSLNGLSSFQAFSESAALQRIAAVPQASTYPPTSQSDSEVRLFSSDYLNLVGRFALQPFTVGSAPYAAHGRYIFFNGAGTFLYAVNQADSSSGLLNDFAVQKISLPAPSSCTVTLDHIASSISSAGSLETVNITASSDCIFQAQSSASWIKPLSGYYGSGSTLLTYLVRPNAGTSSRTGTISVGGQTLTLTQDAAAAIPALNPLSYKVVAADYSKSLDRLVLASGSSNELHLYDAVSGSDQSIDLPAPPLSVSVRPDGGYAAVGHNGWVSYVNLQSQIVEQVIPIETDVHGIILAGNGYLYAFPSRDWSDIYSLHIGDTNWTATSAIYTGREPRLHQSGKYLYVGGNWLSKWDITGGAARQVGSGLINSVSSCGNVWLTEDGQRLINACGSVYRTTESSDDLSANGKLFGNSGIKWAAHSIQQHQTVVITSSVNGSYLSDDTKLQLYGDEALQFIGQNTLPQFPLGSSSFAGHGRFVFWNTAESKMVIVEQADSTSGLLSDYGVYTLDASGGPASCSYQLSATQLSFGGSGGHSSSIGVSATSGCGWNAISGVSWVTITSGSTGNGSGTVNLSVAANTAFSPRSGTLTIAGQTVSILQDASSACTYTLSSQGTNVPSMGGNGTFTITSSNNICTWTAVSNVPWLTIINGAIGYGSATITYNAAPNLSPSTRTGSITAGGQNLIITQPGTGTSVAPGLRFVPKVPCRVADTRSPNGDFGSPTLGGKTSRDFALPNSSCGIPSTALAYSLSVTAVPHGPFGYVTVWPTGSARPSVSTLNSDGRVRANAVIIPAGENGKISVFATDDTEIILDVNGYFVQDSSALAYYPLTPCRVADTRGVKGDLGGPALSGGKGRTLPLRTGTCNIPPAAQAYALNYTVVPKQTLGYLTTWPTGQPRPIVSTLNAPTGAVTANAAIVPAGADGAVDVFASDDTDLIVDIAGYFASPSTGGLSLYPVTPCRVFDSRTTGSGQPYIGMFDINVQGSGCSLPANAQAYALNATVVPSTTLGYLTLWPSGSQQPVVSTLNSGDGAITANMAIITTQNGSVSSFVTDPTHLILDVTGYFAP